MILATVFVWFFAVDVSEQWFKHDKAPRAIGGWTHNGPYKTKAECEAARLKMLDSPERYRDEAHVQWQRPGECRKEDKAIADAIRKRELDIMRGR